MQPVGTFKELISKAGTCLNELTSVVCNIVTIAGLASLIHLASHMRASEQGFLKLEAFHKEMYWSQRLRRRGALDLSDA